MRMKRIFQRLFAERSIKKSHLLILFTAFVLLASPMQNVQGEADNAERVLLIGTDRVGYRTVSEDEDMSRADAILVLAVSPGAAGVRVLSVERDYLVELPDGHGKNKLSTATYFGGPDMLMDAVNGLLGTDISLYMQVDILKAVSIIDSLGGVEVEVLEEELPIVNSSPIIQPKAVAGKRLFDGKQAQAFMRVRDMGIDPIESNSARNDRQMRVLAALMAKLTNMTLQDASRVISSIPPLVETNLSLYDLLRMSQALLHDDFSLNSLQYRRSPAGAYQTRRVNMHQVVIADDMEAEIRGVREFLLYPSAPDRQVAEERK